jgi:DNA-directed RNA polymerase subunit RPC12/RpoP
LRRKSTLENVCIQSWKQLYPYDQRNNINPSDELYQTFLLFDKLLEDNYDKKIHISFGGIGSRIIFKLDPNKLKQEVLTVRFNKDNEKPFDISLSPEHKITSEKVYLITSNFGKHDLNSTYKIVSSIFEKWLNSDKTYLNYHNLVEKNTDFNLINKCFNCGKKDLEELKLYYNGKYIHCRNCTEKYYVFSEFNESIT